jgi:NodT family efflux transporter outer membrane factor (OMF) lipoprotein
MRYSNSVLAFGLGLLQGCTVGPDYHRPTVAGTDGQWAVSAANAAPVAVAPWQSLGDPVLTGMIEAAVAHNLDLREAQANLRAARAQRDAAAGHKLPQLDATASAAEQQISANGELPINRIPGFNRRISLYDVGFDASWEIDLWGGTRRTVEAAELRTQAAQARQHDALLQVVAEVVRTYAELRGTQANLAAARKDADAQNAIAVLVHQRSGVGDASNLDDARAESQAHSAAAAVAGIDASVHAAANELALLTGQPPESLADLARSDAPIPLPPSSVAVGLRADVLRRRPDVRAAEADLAAATNDVGVETANLFPTFSLVGSLGQQAQHPGDLGQGASTYFNVGPSLRWPIFAGGSIRAQIRAADARADAAAARYEKAVLGALSDSETALNRYASARTTLDEREAARARSAAALEMTQQRFQKGDDDRVSLLQAESSYAAAERAWVSAAQESLEDYAALVKALGGGWAPAAGTNPAAVGSRDQEWTSSSLRAVAAGAPAGVAAGSLRTSSNSSKSDR